MSIKVLKFGGSSQSAITYEMILDIIKKDKNNKYIIVLSAIKGITNRLLEFTETKNFSFWYDVIEQNKNLSKEAVGNPNSPFIKQMESKSWDLEKDKVEIVAMGEFFTTNILNEYLNKNGIESTFLSSFSVIKSNIPNGGLMYNKGEFTVDSDSILEEFDENQVIIIPGFSGISSDGFPCLLGRGGSDTTGSILASAVNAAVYEIWTDVNGIYSCDPRVVKNTHIIPKIGYNASQEIAAMGAKVIHPYCILPCAKNGIPIVIKNTFEPNAKVNTIITDKFDQNDTYAVTIQSNVKVFKITSMNMWNNFGFVYDIFSTFKKYNVDVNIINTSQFNITTTTEDTHIENLLHVKKELEQKYVVELSFDNTIVSVVGENIRKNSNIGSLFVISRKYDIILTSYSSNDMTLSWVLKSEQASRLAQELHNKVFEKLNNTIEFEFNGKVISFSD
jgi:diaminopimelate decarboxylase/aspartate kinase